MTQKEAKVTFLSQELEESDIRASRRVSDNFELKHGVQTAH